MEGRNFIFFVDFQSPCGKGKRKSSPQSPQVFVCLFLYFVHTRTTFQWALDNIKKNKGSVKFQHSAFFLVACCGSQRGIDITSKNLRVTIKLLFFHIGIIVNLYLVLSLEILHTWAGLSDHLEKN